MRKTSCYYLLTTYRELELNTARISKWFFEPIPYNSACIVLHSYQPATILSRILSSLVAVSFYSIQSVILQIYPYIRLPINKAAAAVCHFLPTAISGSHLCAVFCQWHKYSGKLGQKAAQN